MTIVANHFPVQFSSANRLNEKMTASRSQHRPALWPLLGLLCLLGLGCSESPRDTITARLTPALPADFPLDLAQIPLSQELEQSIFAGLNAPDSPAENVNLTLRDELEPAIQRPETRAAAGDRLYQLWRRDPTNFLWLTTAIRYNHLLHRTAEMDSLLATPALSDTTSAVGAFAFAVRHYRIGSRGQFYTRAAEAGELPPLSRLILLRKTTMVASHQGRHLAAVRQLLAVLPEVRQVGGPRLETRFWYSIALALKRGGRLDDAVHANAMGIYLTSHTNNPAFEGVFRQQLATVLSSREEYDAALAQFDATIAFGQREDLPWVILDTTDKAAGLCSSRGQFDLALSYDRRNLAHSLAMRDSLNAPRNMMNLADDFLQTGATDSSLAYQQRAVAWERANPHPANSAGLPFLQAEYYCYVGDYDTADSLLTLARHRSSTQGLAHDEALLLLGLVKRSLEMSRINLAYRSQQRLQELQPVLFDQQPDQNLRADLHLATADVYLALGEIQPARAALDSAWQAIPAEGDVTQRDHYHGTAGKLALLRGDLATATQEFQARLDLATAAGNPAHIAASRQLLGRILLRKGQTTAAQALFVDPDQDPSFGGNFRTRLTNLRLQGQSWLQAGRPARAEAVLNRALSLVTPYSPADVTAGLHLELGRALAALGRTEQAKNHYDEADRDLARGDIDLTEVSGYLDDTRRQLALALIAWYKDHDTYRALQVANQALLHAPLLATTELPADDGCRALYLLGDRESYLWSGHANQWQLALLPGRRALQALVVPVVADINQARRQPDQAALARLGQTLLGPLLEQWQPDATLTIVADGFLGNVPWPALILPVAERQMAVERGPLVESPGLGRTQTVPTMTSPTARGLLAVGYNGTEDQTDRLRNAENEARIIATDWTAGPSEILVGPEATWSAGVTPHLADTAVLHLASHARIREGWSSESYLLLAGEQGIEPVTEQAIRELSWPGELVFLSSCDAGRSHVSGGGTMSLATAFLSAGAQAVLASTGKVDDEAGLFLARRFYQYWQKGNSRAEALRSAQLEMLRNQPQWSHPFYWSRYQLVTPRR